MAIRVRGLAGAYVKVPGLKKDTGSWAICHGVFNPVICVDATLPITAGYNALVYHEYYHAIRRHKLKELALLFFAPLVVGLIAWAFYRRYIEYAADRFAYKMYGDTEYRSFLYLHKEPSGWWAKFKYGATRKARYERVTGKAWVVT